jgi:threonine synthase
MKMISTRGMAPAVGASEAMAAGLAPDGGLYMPATLPRLAADDFAGLARLPQIAERLLRPFFAGDPLETRLPAICREAFAVEPALRPLGAPGDYLLELFHGPTAAFKDYGAGFLAACLAALPARERPLTIVVATSGDTGAAVAAAFHERPGFRVLILYPDGRVSPRQAHQLGCFGGNVRALRVAGNFDDCQRLAKSMLSDTALRAEAPLSSANSISLGRLLPQMAYYAQASLAHWRANRRPLGFVVPTGNLGNALACVLVRHLGLPVGAIVLAGNANQVLAEFFAGGEFRPRPSIPTLANAMDVGAPNNFERLDWLYPDETELRRALRAESVDDPAIAATIRAVRSGTGEILCPHTATAAQVLQRLRARGEPGDWCVVATAHPAKFPDVVEPLVGAPVPLPPALAQMLARPSEAEPAAPDEEAMRALIRAW